MRIMTPDEVHSNSALLFEQTLKRANAALVEGKRMFFQSNAGGDTDVPPGYMTDLKTSLEAAGWTVEVVGKSHFHLEVHGPGEIQGK